MRLGGGVGVGGGGGGKYMFCTPQKVFLVDHNICPRVSRGTDWKLVLPRISWVWREGEIACWKMGVAGGGGTPKSDSKQGCRIQTHADNSHRFHSATALGLYTRHLDNRLCFWKPNKYTDRNRIDLDWKCPMGHSRPRREAALPLALAPVSYLLVNILFLLAV